MSGEIKENFIVNEDGTIKRSSNELDLRMLNIIRVGANKENTLAAYRARKNAINYAKNLLTEMIIKHMLRDCN